MKVKVNDDEYYLDEHVVKILDYFKKDIRKDDDKLIIVDGREGSGKSVFAMQMAMYLDPTLTLDRIVFTGSDFSNAVKKAKKYQVVIFDEAVTGVRAARWANEVNQALVELTSTVRQKNLIMIMIIPSFFELMRLFSLHRSDVLFHVYKNKEGQRGFFTAYNYTSKRQLYLQGKKYFSYAKWVAKWNIQGRFTKHYVVDEQEYRRIKMKAFIDAETQSKKGESKTERKWRERLGAAIHEFRRVDYTFKDLKQIFDFSQGSKWAASSITEFYHDFLSKSGYETESANNNSSINVKNPRIDTYPKDQYLPKKFKMPDKK